MAILGIAGNMLKSKDLKKKPKGKVKKTKKPKSQHYLYSLLLNGGNYYIGQTNDFIKRIKQHDEASGGAVWTSLHGVVEILDIIDLGYCTKREACYFENLMTLEYANKFGASCVRGGRFAGSVGKQFDKAIEEHSIIWRNKTRHTQK